MKTNFLVIHTTQTPFDREVTKQDIESWHLSSPPVGRGWSRVGYTDLIQLTGTLVNLHPNNDDSIVDQWEITNGVKGINYKARHIVYAGGINAQGLLADTLNHKQRITLVNFLKQIVLKNPTILIAGHNQFDSKLCPCFDVRKFLRANLFEEKNIYSKPPFYYS